jgi:hypothetical protein
MAQEQDSLSLYLGAGEPGTKSFELGVGVSSLVKVRLLPVEGIDLTLVETADQQAVGDLLIIEQTKLAALPGVEPVTQSSKEGLRSVMSFQQSDLGTAPSLELVARADVDEEAIYRIAKIILENGVFLEGLNQNAWNFSADQALIGINLPLHPGAVRYYEEIGENNLPTGDAGALESAAIGAAEPVLSEYEDSRFFLDFGVGATTLDPAGERRIVEACQYATIFDAAEIRVAGSENGSLGGGDPLTRERVRYVMAALQANANCGATGADIVSAGRAAALSETGLRNRVEVIIMLP